MTNEQKQLLKTMNWRSYATPEGRQLIHAAALAAIAEAERKPAVTIYVRGGVVQGVDSSEAKLEVILIDYDNDEDAETSAEIEKLEKQADTKTPFQVF